MPLPCLLESDTNQISGDSLAAKRVRHEGVLQNDALAFAAVAQKRRGAFPCLRLEALTSNVVSHRERGADGACWAVELGRSNRATPVPVVLHLRPDVAR